MTALYTIPFVTDTKKSKNQFSDTDHNYDLAEIARILMDKYGVPGSMPKHIKKHIDQTNKKAHKHTSAATTNTTSAQATATTTSSSQPSTTTPAVPASPTPGKTTPVSSVVVDQEGQTITVGCRVKTLTK